MGDMNYVSTRDPHSTPLRFTDVLLSGLAEDGGLYVPVTYPQLSNQLHELRGLDYPNLAFQIISPFVDDSISDSDLLGIIQKTYSPEVFGTSHITPITHLNNQIYIQDLSTGPSLAFKDMAMQFLGHLMDFVLTQRGQSLTIVGASSGDTVSAAEEAMKGKDAISVVMLTPKHGMSAFQKAQAGSVLDTNIFNLSVPGSFDVCQDMVKALNRDLPFKTAYNIGAVNSINWGRICAQIVYYFYGYFSATSSNKAWVDVVVPSGNFGNVLAGYVAKQMGLPIRRLIVATNENRVLDTFIKTGQYQQYDVVVTSSPSMDISKASNIERLFFDLYDRDPVQLSKVMTTFETTKFVDLSDKVDYLRHDMGFFSDASTHDERLATMKQVYDSHGYIIDPHTAAAVKAAYQFRDNSGVPMICMETAKPTKFESAVSEAIGFIPERPKPFQGLEEKPQRFFDIDASVEALKRFISTHFISK
jgi:threonine synthase